MMKRNIFTLLMAVGMLCSCSRQETTEVYTSFDVTDTLVADVHRIPPVMLYPRSMFLTDSCLVVFNDKMDTCFQVFDKAGLRYLYSFGVRGEGPSDFRMPSNQLVGERSGRTYVLDVNEVKGISLANGKAVVTACKLPVQRSYYNGLLMLADSAYVCETDFEEEKEYLFIRPDGTAEQQVDYPETPDRFGSVLARNQAYGRIAAAHPSGERFASFYTSDRRFRIIDKAGRLLRDVRLDIAPKDDRILVEPDKRRIYPLAVCATERYIYTLNLDMTPEEIRERKACPSVQKFSWEGKPLKRLYLDRMISSFAIDEKEQTIYGVFAENEDEIYTFDM